MKAQTLLEPRTGLRTSMKIRALTVLAAAPFLSLATGGVPRSTSTLRAHEFETLGMHFEVDLPDPRAGGAMPASLAELPAEVVLQATSRSRFSSIRLLDGDQRTVLELECSDVASLGVSELELETEGITLGQALSQYPAGKYMLQATTVDGGSVEGIVELSSSFPGLFAIVSPRPGDALQADARIAWTPSSGALRYVLEIEQDELGFVLETRLPPSQTSFRIPLQMLEPGETYEYSLVAEGDSDNELEVEGSFVVPFASPGPATR